METLKKKYKKGIIDKSYPKNTKRTVKQERKTHAKKTLKKERREVSFQRVFFVPI